MLVDVTDDVSRLSSKCLLGAEEQVCFGRTEDQVKAAADSIHNSRLCKISRGTRAARDRAHLESLLNSFL